MILGEPIYPPEEICDRNNFSSMREHYKALDDWLYELSENNDLISFVVGDGLAFYLYERPNVLRPVLFLDELEVHPAFIRGLIPLEVEKLVQAFKATGWRHA